MTGRQFSEVDLDLLADYVGGALDGTPEQATVERLVAEDPAWARAHSELTSSMATVQADLAGWGAAAEPMPSEIADRVAAVLTDRESRPALTVVPGERPAARHRSRRRWPGWATPAAVAAGLLVAAGFGISVLGSAGDQDSAGTGEAAVARDNAAEGPPQAMADATQQLVASGRDYRGDTLGGQQAPVTAAQTGKRVFAEGEPGALVVPAALRRLTGADALSACLNAIARDHDRGATTVQAVDYASFEGAPAIAAFFTDGNGERWIWVSGPECGVTGSDTRASARIP